LVSSAVTEVREIHTETSIKRNSMLGGENRFNKETGGKEKIYESRQEKEQNKGN